MISVEILKVNQLNQQGLRVLGSPYSSCFAYSVERWKRDDSNRISCWILRKPSAAPASQALLEHVVQAKILTKETMRREWLKRLVCEKVGLDVDQILLGFWYWRYDGRKNWPKQLRKWLLCQTLRIKSTDHFTKSNGTDIVSAIWNGSMMPLLWKWRMWGFLLIQRRCAKKRLMSFCYR